MKKRSEYLQNFIISLILQKGYKNAMLIRTLANQLICEGLLIYPSEINTYIYYLVSAGSIVIISQNNKMKPLEIYDSDSIVRLLECKE